ncbi:MAG: isoleucine--tRNA ligase, partial [Helicobacteraceae bacterium]
MDYKDTLLLPNTTFPMRGNLTQEEPKKYAEWFSGGVYEKLKRPGSYDFAFHDGPPYANGHIHIGHALNKILKDIVIKTHFFRGASVRFTPGWDCHGLPIEQQVEKKIGREKKETLAKSKIRDLCKAHAKEFIDIQRDEFKTLGVVADWDAPYITMDYAFEANIYRELCAVAQKGLLEERKKPVFWSWAARSALAEAEVEYQDKKDYSLYVSFALSDEANAQLGTKGASVIIWTTTPWTLPANEAIAFNKDEEYVLTKLGFIVAKKRLGAMKESGVLDDEIAQDLSVAALENLNAINPLNGRKSRLIFAEHVTMDNGSGCVHTAPGHGEDDYRVCLKYGIKITMPVDDDGKYDETIEKLGLFKDPKKYLGMHVFDANALVIQDLGAAVIHVSEFTHSYPFCWRTHQPVIYRATKQWFILMDKPFGKEKKTLRQRALEALGGVTFYPKAGINRITSMIQNRPDWCISRQRDWGVPIAFFRHKKTGKVIYDEKVLNFIAMIFEKEGCNAWYERSVEDLLVPGSGYDAQDLEKTNDILDVWFDSGSTQFCVLQSGNYDAGAYPASMYLEGSDQHRGWFQSSLLVSIAAHERAPFESIVTHGFTMDEKGEKMSKSKGNVVAPSDVVKKYGAEILRLWVANSDYQNDQRISDGILTQTAEQYKKLRNTFRFLLANIYDLKTPLKVADLRDLDRWILSSAKNVFDEANAHFLNYDFSKALQKINNFLIVELSGIYLDISKDRLYCDAKDALQRRGAQSALYYIARSLLGLIAPVLTYTADEIVRHAPKILCQDKESIFDFTYEPIEDLELDFSADMLKAARDEFNLRVDELKKQGTIKSTLELALFTSCESVLALDGVSAQDWFLCSSVERGEPKESLASFEVQGAKFFIARALGFKCPRCWKHSAEQADTPC